LPGRVSDAKLEEIGEVTVKKIILSALLFLVLFTSCAPASAPTLTVVDAVATVDKFYKLINDAQTKDDLVEPWVMLTSEEQCNPRDKCELANFQTIWWQWKVSYKLYGCSSNRVVAEEIRYPREDNSSSVTATSQYWEYQLVEFEEKIMISDRYFTQAPGGDCVLMIEESTNP
jgi:hypothetical protein